MSKLNEQLNKWQDKGLLKKQGDCLVWKGGLGTRGYARTTIDGKQAIVHRWVLEQKLGRSLRENELACHARNCNSKACVKPGHLRACSAKENSADELAKMAEQLKCNTGNYQCGGKCQPRSLRCNSVLNDANAQATASQLAQLAGKAKGAIANEDMAVNIAGTAGSIIGSKLGGQAGALAGDFVGAITMRTAIAAGKAYSQADGKGFERLKNTVQELKANRKKLVEDYSADTTGFLIGNLTATLAGMPGSPIANVPLKGAAVAMFTVPKVAPQLAELINRAMDEKEKASHASANA